MTIQWKAVERYFTVVLFVFQFNPVCNFGKFTNFGLGIIRGERVKTCRKMLRDEYKVRSVIFATFFLCLGLVPDYQKADNLEHGIRHGSLDTRS